MIDLCIISGSGFYDFPEVLDARDIVIDTQYGKVNLVTGVYQGKNIAFLARHQQGHQLLPNMINFKANIAALKSLNPKTVIATTVCGIVNPKLPLGKLLIFNDLFYIDNRLPSGDLCSFFSEKGQENRGHLMFDNPFFDVTGIIKPGDYIVDVTYGYGNGPRFNSKKEISFLRNYCDAISQTCGPETILANELELPYILLGFGVDYANGVMKENTPVEMLNKNMAESKSVFIEAINCIIEEIDHISFTNFVYRFGDSEHET
jgi:5'-methylthioadenosine phosphorylase